MSGKLWPAVTAKNPCPVCGKDTWCTLGDFAILCQREPSDHPFVKGGWYHQYQSNVTRQWSPPRNQVAEPLKNASSLIDLWRQETLTWRSLEFSSSLGVCGDSLDWIGAVWSAQNKAWAFPMRDGDGKIIGIRLRNEQGEKWAVRGSRNGLFIPQYFEGNLHDHCFVAEGPTSCAALLTMGLYSIGRPSCNTGGDMLNVALKKHQIKRVVVVADNDDKRRSNGLQWSPGVDGAKALAKQLKLPHVIWIPPTKDVRDFLIAGGTKEVILSAIKNQVWRRN